MMLLIKYKSRILYFIKEEYLEMLFFICNFMFYCVNIRNCFFGENKMICIKKENLYEEV